VSISRAFARRGNQRARCSSLSGKWTCSGMTTHSLRNSGFGWSDALALLYYLCSTRALARSQTKPAELLCFYHRERSGT
jgi:hypothetical protein